MVLVVQEQNVGILCVTRLDCSLQLFPQIVLLPDGLRNIMGRAIMAAHSFLLRSECLIYNTIHYNLTDKSTTSQHMLGSTTHTNISLSLSLSLKLDWNVSQVSPNKRYTHNVQFSRLEKRQKEEHYRNIQRTSLLQQRRTAFESQSFIIYIDNVRSHIYVSLQPDTQLTYIEELEMTLNYKNLLELMYVVFLVLKSL